MFIKSQITIIYYVAFIWLASNPKDILKLKTYLNMRTIVKTKPSHHKLSRNAPKPLKLTVKHNHKYIDMGWLLVTLLNWINDLFYYDVQNV